MIKRVRLPLRQEPIRPLMAAGERLQLRASTRTVVCGMDVYVDRATVGNVEPLEEPLASALLLLAETYPRCDRRMRRDVAQLLVIAQPGAQYLPFTRTISLSPRILLDHPAGYVASILVHEATHARHFAAGIGLRERHYARLERLCIREQRAFLDGLSAQWMPERAHYLAHLEQVEERLSRGGLTIPWSVRERHMLEQGAPRWMVPIARWFVKLRSD